MKLKIFGYVIEIKKYYEPTLAILQAKLANDDVFPTCTDSIKLDIHYTNAEPKQEYIGLLKK